jgi:L-amino acid N-acyltransferase
MAPLIRPARHQDLPAINEIYNEAVLRSTATFDTEPKSMAERASWFAKHGARHPVLVAELEGKVAGWGSLSAWSDRTAYDVTAEVSVYVRETLRGQGIGRKLLEELVAAAPGLGLHSLLSRITEDSRVSIHLHESLGFHHVGVLKEVGRKFGKLLDVYLMQRVFQDCKQLKQRDLPKS